MDDYRIVGSKGNLFSEPAYQVNQAIAHVLTVDKAEHSEKFKSTDHFGGEIKYFSQCILDGEEPEPDGEEGMLDVRVLEAIERALLTGQVQELEPVHRSKRPRTDQAKTLSAVSEPDLVGAHKPSEGR